MKCILEQLVVPRNAGPQLGETMCKRLDASDCMNVASGVLRLPSYLNLAMTTFRKAIQSEQLEPSSKI